MASCWKMALRAPQLMLIALIITTCGCSTYITKTNPDRSGKGKLYSGTRLDFTLLGRMARCVVKEPSGMGFFIPIGLAATIDIPLSLVADTIMLPSDLMNPRPVSEKTPPTEQPRSCGLLH